MKNRDIVRLILFIFFSGCIYLYMGNMLAAQSSALTKEYIKNSYLLWNIIDEIEDSLYKSDPSLQVVFLGNAKEKQLMTLALRYNSGDFATNLIEAYKKRNVEKFAEHKEQIAEQLRPIWREARQERMLKERELKSKQGWIAWIKDGVSDAASRIYRYFFPVAQKK